MLLPVAGALSAFLSFYFAAPFVKSLNRPWLKESDPASHFTIGTSWTYVQHATFGALLCGLFCLILELGRRSPRQVLKATILGVVLGAILNSIADSGADMIGMAAMRTIGAGGSFIGEIAWVTLVPLALSFTIAISVGLTQQRVARAIYSTVIAAVATFFGRIIGSVLGAILLVANSGIKTMAMDSGARMEASIPAWLCEAIAAGIALGLTTLIADRVSRKGSIRLIYGRNEYRDWSLDYQANRIGSGEVEIPIKGFKGVEPVHSCIFRQGHQFVLDSQHSPATLNGYPVQQPAILNHGDTIQIGDATLVFFGAGAVPGNYRPAYRPPMAQEPGYAAQTQGGMMGAPGYATPVQPFSAQASSPQIPMAPTHADPVASIQLPAGMDAAPRLVLVDLGGKEFPLNEGANTIGREAGNMIYLPTNSTVSRQHAVIQVVNGTATVSDVGSANGTRVNKVPISTQTPLSSGDEVTFGSAMYTFHSVV